MAFAIRNLSVLAYANGFTLWHYRAGEEALAAVGARGFFTDAADMLCTGDIVMISAREGARVLAVAPGAERSAVRRAGSPRPAAISLVPMT